MPKKRKKSKTAGSGIISNRRARFDYALQDFYTFGLVLSGWETKALRMGHGHLKGSYVIVKEGELYLTNATIMPTKGVGQAASDTEYTRTRKLLGKKKEIEQLIIAKTQGLSLIPTDFLTKGRFVKLKAATGKGKKQYDKRDSIKKRDQSRINARELMRSS
jgi:SsrA-binding protein